MFEKGKSGNPGGRPSVVKEAMRRFRDEKNLDWFRERLLELAKSEDGFVSMAAIREYHDRAYGKAKAPKSGAELAKIKAETELITEELKVKRGDGTEQKLTVIVQPYEKPDSGGAK